VADVGRRPTLGGDPETRLETHIFDFDGDLYGQEIGVRLIRFLRPDAKFADLEELKAAIAKDAEEAHAALAASGETPGGG
jgi:riboflavin kinase/FMN adenylyltransferase